MGARQAWRAVALAALRPRTVRVRRRRPQYPPGAGGRLPMRFPSQANGSGRPAITVPHLREAMLRPLALGGARAGAPGRTLAVPGGARDRRRRSWCAVRRRRGIRRQGGFRHFVEEDVVPAARQATGNALGGGLVGEGPDPDPVIRAVRAVPRGQVRLRVSVLHLHQYLLGLALLVKGAHLDLIDERFLRALGLRGGGFRDDHPHWGDSFVQDAYTVRRGVGQIDDAAFGVGVRPSVRDLDLDVFSGGAIFD